MSRKPHTPPPARTRDLLPRPDDAFVPAEPYQRGLAWLVGLGHDADAILARAGIRPDALTQREAVLTLAQVEAFVSAAARVVNVRGRALELGGRLLFPAFGDVGFAALTAPTVAEAFVVAERYIELISPLFVLEVRRPQGALHVQLTPAYQLEGQVLAIHIQIVLSTLHALARNALGNIPEGIEVSLPLEDAELAEWLRAHHVKVHPSPDSIGVWLPTRLADASFTLADREAHAGFVARCDELMRSRRTEHPMTRDVRRALHGSGPSFPSVDEVAVTLQLSPRTIHRRLEREGTTFHQLHSEARFSWAARELTSTSRPVTAIAEDLGYSNSANFTRAFGRIFGVSPTEHRRRATR